MHSRDPDKQFVSKTLDKIRLILSRPQSTTLKSELHRRIVQHQPKADFDLILRQWAIDKLDILISKLLHKATVSSLKGLRRIDPEFDKRWLAAREVLGCLSVLYVDSDYVQQMETTVAQGSGFFDVPVITPLAAMNITLRYRQQPSSYERGLDGEVNHGFDGSKLALSSSPEKAVTTFIVDSVWPKVFGSASRRTSGVNGLDSLTENDYEQLNAALRQKDSPRHLLFQPEHGPLLDNPEFIAVLKDKLPDLVIIRMVTPAGNCPVMASSEHVLVDVVRRFLDIPNEICPSS